MPAGAALTVYSNPGQKGAADFMYVSQGDRYLFVPRSQMHTLAAGSPISSLTVHEPPWEIWDGARVLVFGDHTIWGGYGGFPLVKHHNPSGFVGEFLQFSNRKLLGTWERFDTSLSEHKPDLDNRVTGLVLVNTNRPGGALNFPYLVRDMVMPSWGPIEAEIDAMKHVRYRNGPYFRWVARYPGSKYVDPTKVYVAISVGVWAELPGFLPDIKASVTLYLNLWAADGKLNGDFDSVTWWRGSSPVPWVADFADGVMGLAAELTWLKLKYQTLPGIVASFNQKRLADKGRKLVGLYSLPGNQFTEWFAPSAHTVFQGNSATDTDVTLITETVEV